MKRHKGTAIAFAQYTLGTADQFIITGSGLLQTTYASGGSKRSESVKVFCHYSHLTGLLAAHYYTFKITLVLDVLLQPIGSTAILQVHSIVVASSAQSVRW